MYHWNTPYANELMGQSEREHVSLERKLGTYYPQSCMGIGCTQIAQPFTLSANSRISFPTVSSCGDDRLHSARLPFHVLTICQQSMSTINQLHCWVRERSTHGLPLPGTA